MKPLLLNPPKDLHDSITHFRIFHRHISGKKNNGSRIIIDQSSPFKFLQETWPLRRHISDRKKKSSINPLLSIQVSSVKRGSHNNDNVGIEKRDRGLLRKTRLRPEQPIDQVSGGERRSALSRRERSAYSSCHSPGESNSITNTHTVSFVRAFSRLLLSTEQNLFISRCDISSVPDGQTEYKSTIIGI